MYLSRAELDATRRNTMIALASPQKFHGAVESAFPGGRRRRLWRLDTLNGKLYLLLLSEDVPDLTGLCAQFGTGAAPETRAYEPLLERVTPGSCWQLPDRKPDPQPEKSSRPVGTRYTEALLFGRGAGRMAAGTGGKTRLCHSGRCIPRDPEADVSFCQGGQAAGHAAGSDL